MAITENLDTFLADFGVSVTGAVSGTGILDMPDQEVGGVAISTDYSLLGKFSVFGALAYGASLTIGGAGYTVKEVRKIDDGSFCRVSLQKT